MEEVAKASEKRKEMERKRSMAVAQIEKAEAGDTQAFNAVADRMEGKPQQGVELSGPDGGDIPVLVKVQYE